MTASTHALPLSRGAYSAETLTRMSAFPDGLVLAASLLLETHRALPKEVRYVGDLQRWMLSQTAIALHFEHRYDPSQSEAISASSLMKAIADTGIASRNTMYSFLSEMERYRFITPLASTDGRRHMFQATEMSEQLIRRYFDIHLKALDLIDGYQRHALSQDNPLLLVRAQPLFARLLLTREDWYHPPDTIARFVHSDSGISILHDLAKGAPSIVLDTDSPIWIGDVSPNVFAQHYHISKTHAARLLCSAREAGLIGWAKKSNRGLCWISPRLVFAYRFWQAIKLASVSQAFDTACEEAGCAYG